MLPPLQTKVSYMIWNKLTMIEKARPTTFTMTLALGRLVGCPTALNLFFAVMAKARPKIAQATL
jgi:ketopantoate reductase